ncbi:MAG: alkaline phosphatase D family protein [Burkholderiales bacterium]|nr:alkaline phosphatase D family protein [Burkholderiales bacterium]
MYARTPGHSASPPVTLTLNPSLPDPCRRRALRHLFAAGAVPVLASCGAPALVSHARAADAPRFALGVASGSPTADSVVLWTRLAGELGTAEVPVAWELAEDERFTRIVARGSEPARADDAHSVHVPVRGLQPARVYWYRFSALGQQSAVGRTRTAPALDAAVERFDFAVASCQRWDHGHWAAWRDAAAHPSGRPLDLVFFVGDYIYEYGSPPGVLRAHEGGAVSTLEGYRARYAQYKSDPLLQAAHAACPWIVIWDDHEVENDYAGLQGAQLQVGFAARRAAAYRAWWEHMPVPPALRPAADGAAVIHGRLDWGRLARLQWIDTRQFRDPQLCPRPGRAGSNTVRLRDCPALVDEPARSLLGAAQERWLAEGWSLAQPWNLLAQQTLMARFTREAVHASPGPRDAAATAGRELQGRYWTDGWDGYPGARKRLLSVLAERKVPGAVVFGGDVHANYVADLRVDPDDSDALRSPLVATEFCGTSISSRGSAQSAVDAALRFNPHIRYGRSEERGYGRFVLTPARLEADLRVVADPKDAGSAVGSAARFVVEAGRPGAWPAS